MQAQSQQILKTKHDYKNFLLGLISELENENYSASIDFLKDEYRKLTLYGEFSSGNNKRKSKKPYISRFFRHAGRIFDTVLIPNRIINNGRDVKGSAVVFICRCRFGGTHIFISVHTFFAKIWYNIKNLKKISKIITHFQDYWYYYL